MDVSLFFHDMAGSRGLRAVRAFSAMADARQETGPDMPPERHALLAGRAPAVPQFHTTWLRPHVKSNGTPAYWLVP